MLTTEQLNDMADGNWPDSGFYDTIKAMARELLANREAQPVALDVIAKFKEWNPGFPVEKFKADYVIGWVLANYYAPPVPAVPSFDEWLESTGTHPVGWVREVMEESYNACRAAMLAQPVSGGYKFNSPEIPDGWKLVPVEPTEEMLAAAERDHGLRSTAEGIYWSMLAAAPQPK